MLLEGQLGSLRDPDHGIYPYTTSSSPLAGYGTVGAGVPASAIKDVYCVTKAYSSCVGARGPSPRSCLARRPRSCATGAATQVNTAPLRAVRAG